MLSVNGENNGSRKGYYDEMACHRERAITSYVQEVIEDHKLEKSLKKYKACTCYLCSHATIQEVVLSGEEMHVPDPAIKKILAHKIRCPHQPTSFIYEKRTRRCFIGNNKIPDKPKCSACKHSIAVVTVDTQPSQYKVGYPVKVYRTYYKCINRNRLEQLNKGEVYMTSITSCDNFESKEG